jgi:putative FmdB family regulatory protein
MPLYEFICLDCKKEFAVVMSIKERETEKIKCTHCGSENVQQRFTSVFTKVSKKSGTW